MGFPDFKQNLLDWITQQWVIVFGKQIHAGESDWLLGPFGDKNGIGIKFVDQLADREQLIVDKRNDAKGLIQSIGQLNLSEDELKRLSKDVVDFYENTTLYELGLSVKWNPVFKGFGKLVRYLFSNRIQQLNVPIKDLDDSEALRSEIIYLRDPVTMEVKRTIWLRTFEGTDEVVYSGVYSTCKIPSGKTCIKAVFPLPNGNATVILQPSVGRQGELILESAGKRIGDSGFYFLLHDSKGKLWAKFIRSFKDSLVVYPNNGRIAAVQVLTLWNMEVLKFKYDMVRISTE